MATKKTPVGRPAGARNLSTREERFKQETLVAKSRLATVEAQLKLAKIKLKEEKERVKELRSKK
jgi:hypothetical protein